MAEPKMRVQCEYDTGIKVPEQIVRFIHCNQCLRELPRGKSPAEWARTSIGITDTGHFQVWCNRHNVNVALIKLSVAEAIGPAHLPCCSACETGQGDHRH